MNYYKVIDIGDYENDRTHFIKKYSNFIKSCDVFWNPINLSSFAESCPEFYKKISSVGKIKHIRLLKSFPGGITLHIDHTKFDQEGVKARLNIPIANTSGTITSFYEFDEPIIHETFAGTKVWDKALIERYQPVASIEVIKPTVLRTSAIHTVNNIDPTDERIRYVITVIFEEDIVRLLD
jgi:hypothetical protein